MRRTIVILSICIAGCRQQLPDPPPASLQDAVARDRQLTPAQLSVGSLKVNSVGMVLVPIPAGEFVMGSPEEETGRFSNEIQHGVRISRAFYMSATEVTQRQWKTLMGTEPWQGDLLFVKEGSDYPAMFVSWSDAVEFCEKLSQREGLEYRLPTEAEWEYACRAGTSTAYSFGDDAADLGDYAWIGENTYSAGEAYAHRAGEKRPNAWGIYDMHGNVQEWCHDWHGDYPLQLVTDPTGSAASGVRVIRGGRWVSKAMTCRSADRIGVTPDTRDVFVGFRVVLSLRGWNPVGTQTERVELVAVKPAAEASRAVSAATLATEGMGTDRQLRDDQHSDANDGQTGGVPASAPEPELADGYVGSQKCQTCHQHEHATWHDSYHRTMTQLPSPTAVVGDFAGAELQSHGRKFRVSRDAEMFWIEDESQDGQATVRRDVVLCTGSHHMQAYWTSAERGSALKLFQFVWLISEQKWIPRRSSFLTPPTEETSTEAGRWKGSCILCHTTHGSYHIGPPERGQSTFSEFGIACEACHGPGESHVRLHQNPDKSESDDPIVNPVRLSHVRASEVCGRCHMAWTFEEPGSARTLRPGDDVQRTRRVEKTFSQFWRDGMVRTVGDELNGLIESPCYQRGTMSCMTCHTLHQARDDPRPREEWTEDMLKPQMRTNKACLDCHEEYRSESSLVAHTHHSASSDGSLCYNCHMPNTAYGLLKESRCHQISNPSVSEFLNGNGRPNACNLCHLDKSLGWTDQAMVNWYGQKPTPGAGKWPDISLSIDVALRGDPAQRALIAWHMGWEPARQASNDQWFTPYLAVLMEDDYPAVRFIAERSLGRIPGYGDIPYDPEMPADDRAAAVQEITERWEQQRLMFDRPDLFIGRDGSLQQPMVDQMLRQRVKSRIYLDE